MPSSLNRAKWRGLWWRRELMITSKKMMTVRLLLVLTTSILSIQQQQKLQQMRLRYQEQQQQATVLMSSGSRRIDIHFQIVLNCCGSQFCVISDWTPRCEFTEGNTMVQCSRMCTLMNVGFACIDNIQYKANTVTIRPPNTRTKMYTGSVACCPLVNQVEYAPRALFKFKTNGTDRRTDRRRTDAYYACR